jgi:NTE family protein
MADLFEKLPDDQQSGPEAQLLRPPGERKVYNIVHLISRSRNYEGNSKDYNFSRTSMQAHWSAGYQGAIGTRRHRSARAPHQSRGRRHLRLHPGRPRIEGTWSELPA